MHVSGVDPLISYCKPRPEHPETPNPTSTSDNRFFCLRVKRGGCVINLSGMLNEAVDVQGMVLASFIVRLLNMRKRRVFTTALSI